MPHELANGNYERSEKCTACSIDYGRHMAPGELSIAAASSALLGEPTNLVRLLSGGTHAETALISAAGRELVARRFPPGDDAVANEVRVLERVSSLGALVPQLVAYTNDTYPLIVTTKVEGHHPDPSLRPAAIAHEMGRMLARLHAVSGAGLERSPKAPPSGDTAIAQAA